MIRIAQISAKSIISRSKISDFSFAINAYRGCPHACIYCYAEFMNKFRSGDEKWGEFIDIKEFDPIPLEKFMKNYKGEKLFMSSVTDCYNPFEVKFKNTRKTLEILANSDVKLFILTKSKLVLRDVDLFKTMPNLTVGMSFSTLEDELRKVFEPRASGISERLEALRVLKQEGVRTLLFVSPIFPAITPVFEFIDRYGDLADRMDFEGLNLYPAFRDRILAFIGRNFPSLLPLYKKIYLFNDRSYFEELKIELDTVLSERNIKYRIFFH